MDLSLWEAPYDLAGLDLLPTTTLAHPSEPRSFMGHGSGASLFNSAHLSLLRSAGGPNGPSTSHSAHLCGAKEDNGPRPAGPALSLLMGCSSAALPLPAAHSTAPSALGDSASAAAGWAETSLEFSSDFSSGAPDMVLALLNRHRCVGHIAAAVVGTLWDVTDGEIDRFSESLLCALFADRRGEPSSPTPTPHGGVGAATAGYLCPEGAALGLESSRAVFKLSWLMGCAPTVWT